MVDEKTIFYMKSYPKSRVLRILSKLCRKIEKMIFLAVYEEFHCSDPQL